jgi:hypothetical protein
MRLSINVALPTVGADHLDTTGMVGAAGGATNSQRIRSWEQQPNVQITPPRHTSTSKTGTTATLTVVTLTTGTPARHATSRALHTIQTQRGPS